MQLACRAYICVLNLASPTAMAVITASLFAQTPFRADCALP